MAEVRKKVVEDKYNTSNIKTKEAKKVKVSEKKKSTKKKEKEVAKKSFFAKMRIFFNGVKSEYKKVHWTPKNDMIKYSISSIIFILFCSGFFYLINIIFALVQSLFN